MSSYTKIHALLNDYYIYITYVRTYVACYQLIDYVRLEFSYILSLSL